MCAIGAKKYVACIVVFSALSSVHIRAFIVIIVRFFALESCVCCDSKVEGSTCTGALVSTGACAPRMIVTWPLHFVRFQPWLAPGRRSPATSPHRVVASIRHNSAVAVLLSAGHFVLALTHWVVRLKGNNLYLREKWSYKQTTVVT